MIFIVAFIDFKINNINLIFLHVLKCMKLYSKKFNDYCNRNHYNYTDKKHVKKLIIFK